MRGPPDGVLFRAPLTRRVVEPLSSTVTIARITSVAASLATGRFRRLIDRRTHAPRRPTIRPAAPRPRHTIAPPARLERCYRNGHDEDSLLTPLDCRGRPRPQPARGKVVLISLDGFPAYALDDPKLPVPTLRRLMRNGVHAAMTAVSPTVTWPNHWEGGGCARSQECCHPEYGGTGRSYRSCGT
jgi:hypothetical protein